MHFEFETRTAVVRGRLRSFKVFEHPGAVAIVAVRDGRVALISQYRPAAGRELWELPAGTLERGEEPAACAKRELAEETGFRAGRVEPLGGFFLAPGYSTEWLHVFLATELTEGESRFDDAEEITALRWLSPAEWRDEIAAGTIADAKTIAALTLYTLHGARL
ncbi:MAG TPA: NUDIX hydrolase [Limnochordia bacterium]